MKKITSLLLFITLMIFMAVMPVGAVSIYTDGDYSYADIDVNNVALYAYNGDSDVLVIPEEFAGRVVSEVYDYAFENNADLTALDFSQNSNRLKNIGIKSFAECIGLTGDCVLPSSIRSFNIGSFQGCTGFTSLVVNTGVRVIPRQCFNRCSGLEKVYLPSELESIDDLAFGNCGYIDEVYIPNSVTYISDTAFSNSYPTFYCNTDSYAHRYAAENNIPFVLLDAPLYQQGDVNRDTVVDVTDVTVVQQYAALLVEFDEQQLALGDMNGDNVVDISDATAIQRLAAGLQ